MTWKMRLEGNLLDDRTYPGRPQASVQDRSAFHDLDDYVTLCRSFLALLERTRPTRIISPTHSNYIFYQYDETHSHHITRPLNTHLFIESEQDFLDAFDKCLSLLDELKWHQEQIADRSVGKEFAQSNIINKAVYTIQQSIGSIGDSFQNPNQ